MAKSKLAPPAGGPARTSAHVGDPVIVEVRSGGATGFAWEPAKPLPTGVQIETERTIPDPAQGIGGMGTEKLKFSFSHPGHYDLVMGFVSPGGTEVVEKKNFIFDVD